LRTILHDAVFASPPPEFALVPPKLRETFNQVFQDLTGEIQPTFEIDGSLFGADAETSITGGLAQAEEKLVQARQIFGYFQLAYKLLIVLILLSMASIILIHRQVRGAIRDLSTIFLSYGAFEYAGILVGRYFAKTQLPLGEIPSSLQRWAMQFIDHLLSPLGTFSLSLLIGDVVLLVVFFVYRRCSS